jgi:diguanylate cyclase (GGDEF)-like protein
MMPAWRRYLFVGLAASAGCVALPLGVTRDIVYCLIGASGAAAIVVGVRRFRPAHPIAWYLIAAGTVVWVLGDGLYGWFQHILLIEPFPSLADVFYLCAYPLFAAGLWVLVISRGPERGPNSLLDTAILTVGLALPAWMFLIAPTWTAYEEPLLNRLVGVAYPLCDGLLFAILVRLAMAMGAWNTPSLLVAGSVGSLVVADTAFAVSAFVPAFFAYTYLLDSLWLASYVLWGAAALHPLMPTLSARAPERIERTSTARMVTLTAAVAIGPVLIIAQLIADVPVQNVAISISSGLMVPLILVRMVRLVRQLEDQAKRLERLADTDYVTGLANSRHLAERLDEILGATRPAIIGFLVVDLERFSEMNDTLGRGTADAILHAVGVRLGELTGDGALVARMSSDQFGVLDPSITCRDEASRAAVRIRKALERPLELPDLSVSVEVAVGALVLPADGTEAELALLRADAALSAARMRPGRTACYGSDIEGAGTLAPLVIRDLREAIEHGDLVLHYQPQVQILTGRVLGVEALVRWQHPRHGLLGPDTFIPAAEQSGLIGPLTQHVLDSALRQCARWLCEGLDLTVAVNLSVRNLLDPGLVEDVREALLRHGLAARSLELEITETSAMVDPRRSIEVLGELARMGVKLSIDDYGTGHSSLAYLQKLPVSRLKMDRSFVTGLVDHAANAAIVHSTIDLARALHFEILAEGVEDDATLLRLRAMKCDDAQGFGLGRPVAAPLIPELIRSIEERLRAVLGIPDVRVVAPIRAARLRRGPPGSVRR